MATAPKPFQLAPWYGSEEAKRRLGPVCKAVNVGATTTYLLGTPAEPLLVLDNADDHLPPSPSEVTVTIDEARADWSAIVDAALLYGTVFRIQNSRKVARAVLFRHPKNRHPAVRYQRSASADVEKIAARLDALAAEVRKLGVQVKRNSDLLPKMRALVDVVRCLTGIAGHLDRSACLIDRRFREAWRLSDGLPTARPH